MVSLYSFDLDEIKDDVEKLRRECQVKMEVCNSLKKAHADQLTINERAELEIKKLAQDLNSKSEEMHEIRQMYEELKPNFNGKDFSSKDEKYGEKISKLADENRDLLLAFDEASARIHELEKKTCASDEEIASLKRLLLVEPEKAHEVKKNEAKDLKERDKYILKLEEEARIIEDQLKRKNEQFSHLEEAHRKLRIHFQVSRVEWRKEKSDLFDELSTLQANLDAQIRVSKSRETQLRLCNQALAREESRRKVLEMEVTEYKSRLENGFLEYEVAKSDMEQVTMKRDEDIAELRNLLRKKEMIFDDMKYRTAQLESDLADYIKDIQWAQLNGSAAPSSSSEKLRNEFQGLVQLRNKCAANLKDKEAGRKQTGKLRGDLTHCLSELDGKNKSMMDVYKELEDCKCLLEVKDEEIFALSMALKSKLLVTYSKDYDAKEELEICGEQIEERNAFLEQQLERKHTELHKVNAEVKQKCDEITALKEQVEALYSVEQRDTFLAEVVKRCKEMLDESNE